MQNLYQISYLLSSLSDIFYSLYISLKERAYGIISSAKPALKPGKLAGSATILRSVFKIHRKYLNVFEIKEKLTLSATSTILL